MREHVLPILERHGVDLVLAGHSHSYERSMLLDGHYGSSDTLTAAMKKDPSSGRRDQGGPYVKAGAGPSPREGAVYVVAGSSGLVSPGFSLDHPVMLVNIEKLGSLVIDVNGLELDAAFLRETGAVEDRFAIRKGAGGDGSPRPGGGDGGMAMRGGGAGDGGRRAGDGGGADVRRDAAAPDPEARAPRDRIVSSGGSSGWGCQAARGSPAGGALAALAIAAALALRARGRRRSTPAAATVAGRRDERGDQARRPPPQPCAGG
jgi:hypothetical protein